MILTHRPLQMPWGQPVTEARRSRYTFKANWSATLDLLDRELWHLDASSVVLQVDVTEADLRLDGQLRANARPDFPGVRLIVDSPRGTLSWQTDVCEFWQHNVRSIALGLEALRAVDRYGITTAGEQYKGWLQLEAGSSAADARRAAQKLLAREAWPNEQAEAQDSWSLRLGDTDFVHESASIYRRALAKTHPDRLGGMRSRWDAVEAAGKLLGLAG